MIISLLYGLLVQRSSTNYKLYLCTLYCVPLLLSEEVSGHAVVVVEDGDDLSLDGLVVHVGQRHPVTLAAVHRLAGPGPCHLGLGVTEPNPRRRDININTRGNSP